MWHVWKLVHYTSGCMCPGSWVFLHVMRILPPTPQNVFVAEGRCASSEFVFWHEIQSACSGTPSLAIARLCSVHTLPAPSWIIHPFGWSNTHLLFILHPWCQATRAATSLWNLKGALLWARRSALAGFTVCNTLQQSPLWGDLHKLNRNLSSRCPPPPQKKWAALKEKMSLNPNCDFQPFSKWFSVCGSFFFFCCSHFGGGGGSFTPQQTPTHGKCWKIWVSLHTLLYLAESEFYRRTNARVGQLVPDAGVNVILSFLHLMCQ